MLLLLSTKVQVAIEKKTRNNEVLTFKFVHPKFFLSVIIKFKFIDLKLNM